MAFAPEEAVERRRRAPSLAVGRCGPWEGGHKQLELGLLNAQDRANAASDAEVAAKTAQDIDMLEVTRSLHAHLDEVRERLQKRPLTTLHQLYTTVHNYTQRVHSVYTACTHHVHSVYTT